MNRMVSVFRALVEMEDYLKTYNGLDSSIEVYISEEDNERIITENWQYAPDKKCSISSFEGIPIKIDTNLKIDEFKIKVNWAVE